MSVTDVLDISENATDEEVYNYYVKMVESVKASMEEIQDSDDAAADNMYEKYRQLEALYGKVHTDIVNSSDEIVDGNALFYKALDRINVGNDIYGCKKTAEILKEYLTGNSDSVMGETLLEIISEQFKV